MSIGFHFDDIEEAHLISHDDFSPIGAPIHDLDEEIDIFNLPPIGAPIHDNDKNSEVK